MEKSSGCGGSTHGAAPGGTWAVTLGHRNPKSRRDAPVRTDLAQIRLKPSRGRIPAAAAASGRGGEEGLENPSFVSDSHGSACLDQLPFVRWELPRAHAHSRGVQSPLSLCPVLLGPLLSLPRVTRAAGAAGTDPPVPPELMPARCSRTHIEPFIVVPGSSANTGTVETRAAETPLPGQTPQSTGERGPQSQLGWSRPAEPSLGLRRGPARAP